MSDSADPLISPLLEPVAAGNPAVQPADATVDKASLRVVFARGMIWTGLATIFAKIVSFVSQFLLGRIFHEDMYGLFAMAVTAATIGEVLANGGIRTVVISRAHEYARIARTASAVAIGISAVAALLLAVTAPFWAYAYYRQPSVMYLLFIMAGAILVSSFGAVQRARLDSELRVRTVSMIDTGAIILRHSCVVTLAYLHFREYSFVWPVLMMNAFYAIAARFVGGKLPASRINWPLAKELLGQGKWVVIAGIGATLIARGDYFVGGGFARYHPEWVGILGFYFFGYQLTFSLFGPFNIGLNGILQPAFARMKANLGRQAEIYYTVVRMTVFLAAPLTIAGALVAPLLIHSLWPDGRWDKTIPVVQMLAITEAVRQLHIISVAVLSARERFREASFLTLIDGFTTMLAALIGCTLGGSMNGLLSLTLAIAIQRTVMSLIESMVIYRMIGGNAFAILYEALKPLVPALLVGVLAYAAVMSYVHDLFHQHLALAGSAVPFFAIYVLLAKVFTPAQYHEALDLVRRMLPARWRASSKPVPVASDGANG